MVTNAGDRLRSDLQVMRADEGASGEGMKPTSELIGIIATLLVEGDRSLFIMLGADGNINRQGTGSLENKEIDLFIGKADPELFRRAQSHVSKDLLKWFGTSLGDPTPKGKICELTVSLQDSTGDVMTTHWRYGAQSQGPPPDVCQFVVKLVDLTNPWFVMRKSMAR